MAQKQKAPGILEELGIAHRDLAPSQELLYNLGRLYTRLNHLLARRLQPFGLTVAQLNAMALLWFCGSLSQKELGRKLLVSGANITGLVDRLEALGLAGRGGAEDRRVRLVRLTRRGEKLLETIWPIYSGEVESLTSRLAGQRIAALIELLGLWRTSLPPGE